MAMLNMEVIKESHSDWSSRSGSVPKFDAYLKPSTNKLLQRGSLLFDTGYYQGLLVEFLDSNFQRKKMPFSTPFRLQYSIWASTWSDMPQDCSDWSLPKTQDQKEGETVRGIFWLL